MYVYLNGDGIGENNHLSLLFVLNESRASLTHACAPIPANIEIGCNIEKRIIVFNIMFVVKCILFILVGVTVETVLLFIILLL
jgi:hypothetical protein